MILFILLAVVLAAVRGHRVSVIFREVSLLPMLIDEIVFWVFQISAWRGDYRFLPYSGFLQAAGILVLIWPILKFRLYSRAVWGSCAVAVGSVMNKLVMKANGGAMPVFPTLSVKTGYYRDGVMEAAGDARHVLMSGSTKMNVLADYIDVGFSIMSLGDLLIHGFTTLVVYGVIAELNKREG